MSALVRNGEKVDVVAVASQGGGGQTFSGVVCVEGEPTVDITVEEVQG